MRITIKKALLLIILVSSYAMSEKQKIYVESTIFFIPENRVENTQIMTQMKKHYGGFNEVSSSEDETSGEWHMQIRLSDANIYNVLLWTKDKNNPEINQNFDVSSLEMTTYTLLTSSKGVLKINIIPKVVEDKLEPIQLSADNFGLNHFCLKNSAMIIDDNFYIGKLQGFAERIEIRIPDFYNIDISLKPLRDWQQIGTYEDGVINIDVKNNHTLTLLNVGIGPSGYQKGGPFKIYGALKQPTHNRQKLLDSVEKHELKDVSDRIKRIIMKANHENKYSVAGITTAGGNSISKHLIRAIGNMFIDENCG